MITTAAEMHMRRAIREAAPQAKAKLDTRQVAMLARACARVTEGRRPPNDARPAVTAAPRPAPVRPRVALSTLDHKVLRLVAAGAENTEIAGRLRISSHEVKVRLHRIYGALSARNRTQAVALGYELGLLGLAARTGPEAGE